MKLISRCGGELVNTRWFYHRVFGLLMWLVPVALAHCSEAEQLVQLNKSMSLKMTVVLLQVLAEVCGCEARGVLRSVEGGSDVKRWLRGPPSCMHKGTMYTTDDDEQSSDC